MRVRKAYKAGLRRVLISLPTGTGKTVVFAHFPRALKMKKRLLVLAHREELLVQAQNKFQATDPDLRVEIEQASSRASDDAQVVIASVQTLSRKDGARLSRLNPDDFSIVVVDEAHHAVAPTYRQIFDHFGLFEPTTPRLLIGFTATPRRGDNQGLGSVFQDVCYARDLREMIQEGYLARISGWRIDTGVSLDAVKVRRGEFVEDQLARVVNTPDRNRLLVQAYRDLARGRRAIVFCVDVAHARAAEAAFADAGVSAAAVWGALPRDERRARLARFSSGELDVVTNCVVLTEGFDEPRVDCVIMARPTRSKLLYAQMIGRGTRRHPEKRDLLVIDLADNSTMHQLPGLHSLFNLPANMNLEGRDALAIEREIEHLNRVHPWVDTARIHSPRQLVRAAKRIEFFNFDLPEELREGTENNWYSIPGGSYMLGLPNGEWVSIAPNLLDSWDVEHGGRGIETSLVARDRSLALSLVTADRFAAVRFPDASSLIRREQDWHDRDPTEKQREMLARYGIDVPAGLTRGQVSKMISMVSTSR